MAYKLCLLNKDKRITIGNDNGYVGGQNYYRVFEISIYEGRTRLREVKNGKNFADYSRYVEIINYNPDRPTIKPYVASNNENYYQWIH